MENVPTSLDPETKELFDISEELIQRSNLVINQLDAGVAAVHRVFNQQDALLKSQGNFGGVHRAEEQS